MWGEEMWGVYPCIPIPTPCPPLAHKLHAGLVQLDGLGERAGSCSNLRER